MLDWREEVRRRLARVDLRPEHEADLADELAQHLADRFAELRHRVGDREAERVVLAEMSSMLSRELRGSDSRRDAREPIGSPTSSGWISVVASDVRYALRSFRLAPAFSLVAIATLALGIGGSTLIFSAVNGILLKPLPFPEPDRLVRFWGTAPEKGLPEVEMPQGVAAVFRDQTRTLEHFAGFEPGAGFNLISAGDAERVTAATVSLDFFRVLGVAPMLGRSPTTGEDVPNGPRVTVLSHGLWLRRFGGDSAIVGQTIDLSGVPTTVVGVMPARFDFPVGTELWVPIDLDPNRFGCWCLTMIGRMKPGVTHADVRSDLTRMVRDIGRQRPDVFSGPPRPFVVMSLADKIVGNVRRPLLVLLGAVGCVLLIVCANIANLLLVRTTGRARELAVRCCLGASRGRIAAQLLTESLLLSLIGASIGALLALSGVKALRRLPVELFPRVDAVRLDGSVLLFTIGIATLTGIACGLASAIRATRVDLQDAIKNGVRGSQGTGARHLSDAFVVLQFALSLVLLVSAGLLVRSYVSLVRVDAGYRTRDVLVARVQLPYPRYDSAKVVRAFYDRLRDRVRGLPGVQSVGLASRVPLTRGNPQDNIVAEGREPRPGEPLRVANIRGVDEGYFDAIGTPLLRGRRFAPSDDARAPRVAIVDEAFARHFWPNRDALGKRFRHPGDTSSTPWLTVVGIVPNVKHNRLDEPTDLQEYEAFAQRPYWTTYLVVRTTAPDGVVASIRREVRALDPTLPIYDVRTMESAVERSLSTRRLTNTLLLSFALSALVLAAIGIYGVISIGVAARVREFGIRIALGAKLSDLGILVVRQALTLALIGIGAGFLGAVWSTRALQGLLYGVDRFDWLTFATVAFVLVAASFAASYIPARRATRADPMLALRSE